jgi:hypothetical protein
MRNLNIIIPLHIKRIFGRGGVCPLPSLFKFTFLLLIVLFLTDIARAQEVWQNYTNTRIVNCLAIEGDYLWEATIGGVIKRSIINTFTDVVYYTKTNSGLAYNYVFFVAVDGSSNKWFGTTAGGVSKFDGTNWTTYNTFNSGLVNDHILSIAIDSSGNKWFGTYGSGLSKFDGTNWTTYNTSNSGLTSDWVVSMAVDRSGNIWFSAYGVDKFDGTNWTNYNRSNSGLISNAVTYIAIDSSNNKWFATWNGVSKFDGINWTTYNTSNSGLANDNVYYVIVDCPNNKWFGTDGGVSVFDDTNWTNYTTSNSGLVSNRLNCIAIDGSGNKWFGTFGSGVSKFDGTNWTTYNTFNSGLPNDFVYAIAIDGSGNKWFATSGGVAYLGVPTSVPEEEQPNIPLVFELFQNYPNPFNPNTTIPFTVYGSQFIVHSPIHTTLKIYNIRGQKVRTLVDDERLPGYYQVFWDGKDNSGKEVASGIYFYQLKAKDYSDTRKMILLR